MATAAIAIGSNLGDRASFLDRAVDLLARTEGVRVLARSRNCQTAPEGGPPGQPMFLNAAVLLEIAPPMAGPRQLLSRLIEIESALGRPAIERRVPLGPRTIDLDLLLYDDQMIDERAGGQGGGGKDAAGAGGAGLTVPHPRMHLRRFVLEPLAEIAPHLRHPLLNVTVAELLAWLDAPPLRE